MASMHWGLITQSLLFVGAIVGLLAIVPLATWAATGRLADAWRATVEYLLVMAIIIVPGFIIGAIAGLFAWLVP